MKNTHRTNWKNLTFISIAAALTACGGGSTNDNSTASVPDTDYITPSYEPETNRLYTEASSSDELYVEPNFAFDLANTVNFYFTVHDATDLPITDTLIKVYAVPSTTENWDELAPIDKQLLFIGKTDSNGVFNRKMEMSPANSKILAVVATLGIDNTTLLNVDSNDVSHHF